jgi:DNA-binding Lrp family transcriptional regulator
MTIFISHMPSAYVLINCEIGSEKHIISKLNNLSGVEEVSEVNGIYDIIVKVNSDSIDKLKETITTGIRRIDRVRSTLTLIVIE